MPPTHPTPPSFASPALGDLATRLAGWDDPAVGAYAADGARLPSTKYARRGVVAAGGRSAARPPPRANVAVPFASDPTPLREFLEGNV